MNDSSPQHTSRPLEHARLGLRPAIFAGAHACVIHRWGIVRLICALVLLWLVAADSPARLARLTLASLPPMDYAAEVASLRDQRRFAEALMVADAGLIDAPSPEQAMAIARERQATIDARDSWVRFFKDSALGAGKGALTGRGETLEELVGAVTADLFVVGDVRDLLIQGFTYAGGGETDPLIIGLSAVGLVTTVAPMVDWAPALLKTAKKLGSLGKGLEEFLLAALKNRRIAQVRAVLDDVGTIAFKTSPSTATRVLKFAEHPDDVARVARFLENAPDQARAGLALHVAGKESVALLRLGDDAAGVLKAGARKGRAGAAFLASPMARAMVKPHPLVGLLKGLSKGTLPNMVAQGLVRIDPHGWWVLPALVAWAGLEAMLLVVGWTREVRTARLTSRRLA